MNLNPIQMDRHLARRAFIDYRNALREQHSTEDEAIMRGYRELAKGRQLISLTETLRAGGVAQFNKTLLPRLAICRAHVEWCWIRAQHDGSAIYSERENWAKSNEVHAVRRVPAGTFDGMSWAHARAMVPVIPPALRPPHDLINYHILWEAEWQRVVPTDPALLKHIGGDLYAVLAVWDLTELERTVLAGRFTRA